MHYLKKILLSGIIVLLSALVLLSSISCVSHPSPDSIDLSAKKSAKKVVTEWASGLDNTDIELLMDTYWPEAVFTFIPPEGDNMVLTGSEAIRSGQEGGFVDRPDIDILLDSAEVGKNDANIIYTIDVVFPDGTLVNVLYLEERDNEWKIIKQDVSVKLD